MRVNDGSNDKTSYALSLFKDEIVVIDNNSNRGLPVALNEAVLASRGTFVVRVDSDDYVNANFLTVLTMYVTDNPDVDAVACDYWITDDDENRIDRRSCADHPIGCGIMFRKSDLITVGLYDPQFRKCEDEDLRIRFAAQFSITRVALPLYRYRRHSGNMTNDRADLQRHQQLLLEKHPHLSGKRTADHVETANQSVDDWQLPLHYR